jgi:phage gp16-like protein
LSSGNQDEAPIQIVKTASSQVTLDELQVLLNKVGEKATENAVNIKLNLEKIKVLQKKVDMGSEFKGQEVTPAAAVDDIQFQELEYKFATLEK